jgi:flagellum-specific peptidoglycan hydrolase FlgJ
MSKQTEFIEQIKNPAILSWCNNGVLPSLVISQACHESSFGTSELAVKANNLFGIKHTYGYDSYEKQTKEYSKGTWTTITATFRKYANILDSIKDHGEFLKKDRYKKVLTAQNYIQAATEVYRAGYATDPGYTAKLIALIEKYKLYQVDDMVTAWEHRTGVAAIKNLVEKHIINNPDTWMVKDLKNEQAPLWLVFDLANRSK